MNTITMHKYQCLGSAYFIFDPGKNKIRLREREIQKLCGRKFGVDADGIVHGPVFADGKTKAFVYHPDECGADGNGNGIWMFAKYLQDFGYASETKLVLTAPSGDIAVEFPDGEGSRMRVNLGKAGFLEACRHADSFSHLFANEPLMFGGSLYNAICLSMGNPDCVIMTEDVSGSRVRLPGFYAKNDASFPDRMHLQLCKAESRSRIRIEHSKRGAHFAPAFCRQACAAAAAAWHMGIVDDKITVVMPDGTFFLEVEEDGCIYMTYTAAYVGSITLAENFFA